MVFDFSVKVKFIYPIETSPRDPGTLTKRSGIDFAVEPEIAIVQNANCNPDE